MNDDPQLLSEVPSDFLYFYDPGDDDPDDLDFLDDSDYCFDFDEALDAWIFSMTDL